MSKKFNKDIGMSQDNFDEIIKAFKMERDYVVKSIGGRSIIVESWHSDINPLLSLNRTFDINTDNLSKIEPVKRKELLQEILKCEVELENYEQASVVRDLIAEIK